MTFFAYVQRQRSLIRSRRAGQREGCAPECDTEKLFEELSSIKGLNTAERERYSASLPESTLSVN